MRSIGISALRTLALWARSWRCSSRSSRCRCVWVGSSGSLRFTEQETDVMELTALTGPKSFLIAPFLVGLPLWFAMLQHRASILAWIVSPLTVVAVGIAGMLVFA